MEHVTKLLSPYMDGQVTARQRHLVEAHLAVCGACRRELAELRATVDTLRCLPAYVPPRSFALGPRAAAPARRPSPVAARLRPFASIAAVLVVAAVGFSWGLRGLPRNYAAPAIHTGQTQSQAVAAHPLAAAAPVAAGTAPSRAAAPGGARSAAAATGAETATRPAPAASARRPSARPTPPVAQQAGLNLPLFLGELAALLLAVAGVIISTVSWLAEGRR